MKLNKFFFLALTASALFVGCSDDDENNGTSGPDFTGTYNQKDQMGRPAINTVFIASGAPKDAFNSVTPSMMGGTYQPVFESRLLALNPGYTTNALGQTAAQFTGLLAADVLNVSKTATTTFFDGTNVLTGRTLSDDVIDVELLLIFGGPDGSSNSALTSDNVDSNDKAFTSTFPYLASPW